MRAALFAIVFLAYCNSFGLGLALDGRRMTAGDPRVHAATSENLGLIFSTHYWYPENADRLYRPITTASFLLNYAVLGNGANAFGYHAVNFLLHLLNAWLVFELARRLFPEVGHALACPAALAAALWAVHPAGTEVVSNIAGRADLLATAAVLGGLLIYVRRSENLRPLDLAALFAVATAGVFSKESAAVLIGLMLLWDVAFGADWRKRWPAYAAASLPLLLLWMARTAVFRNVPWPPALLVENPLFGAGFTEARLTALKVIGMELGLLAWPSNLAFDHSYNQIPISGSGDFGAWAAAILIVAIVAVAIFRRRKDPVLFWAAGFLGITLLPTSNLVVLIGSIMALRFLYLPAIGFAVAIVALIWRLRNPRLAQAILLVAIAVCAARTFARNPAWTSDLALAANDVPVAPASFRTHRLLAEGLYQENPTGNLDAAIREMKASWEILKPLPPASIDSQVPSTLGAFYQAKREYEKSLAPLLAAKEAADAYRKNFDETQLAHGKPLEPVSGGETVYLRLAKTYAALGRNQEAQDAFFHAKSNNPVERAVYDDLAGFYATMGDLNRAAIVLDEKALVLGMSQATLTSLRNVYARIPDGACALTPDGKLNPGCPRLRSDACAAWTDAIGTFREARLTDKAAGMQMQAQTQYGCAAK